MTTQERRKPVAMSMTPTRLFVVCDDGSVWAITPSATDQMTKWTEIAPIPGCGVN